jgi:hypothetical protein
MRTLLLSLTACILGGCGTYGEPLFLARMYDSADHCQRFPQPSYCGAGTRGRTTIYATPTNNPIGAPIGYTKKN